MDSFSFAGFGTLTMTANTNTLTKGRYHLAEPRKFFDQTSQYDFSWDTLCSPAP